MWTSFIGPRSSAKSNMFFKIPSRLRRTRRSALGVRSGCCFIGRPLVPIVLNRGLDMRDGFSVALGFEEMAKAPLTFEILFHRFKLARDIGVCHCTVNGLFQRPDPSLDCKPRNFDGPLGIHIPTRRTG